MVTETKPTEMHLGRKISRIRELRGMKQETLAQELGISQQAISKLEQSEHIEDEKLEQVAKALGVSADAIRGFDEQKAINIISSTLHDTSIAGANYNPVFNFNPIEKIVELYERMLTMEKEKNDMLEKLLQEKK